MRLLVIEDYAPLAARWPGAARQQLCGRRDRRRQRGLWYAESGGYDAIVLDLMLPGIDGLRSCAGCAPAATPRTCSS
jgi:two-component system OmpR family response regulator